MEFGTASLISWLAWCHSCHAIIVIVSLYSFTALCGPLPNISICTEQKNQNACERPVSCNGRMQVDGDNDDVVVAACFHGGGH